MKEPLRASSPFATGDYGGRYQDRVAGYLLGYLLMNQPIPGQTESVVRVAFQRRTQGALLDDVVLDLRDGSTIELSIKAGLRLRSSDPELKETIERAWRIYKASPSIEHRYGLVAPNMSPGLDSLKLLTFLAAAHDHTGDFMAAAFSPGVIAKTHRDRFSIVRRLLDDASGALVDDKNYHAFLKRFTLLDLDLELPPATHLSGLLIALESAQGISHDQASTLAQHLIYLAADAEIASAAFDRAALSRRLKSNKVLFGASRDLRPTFEALQEYASRAREAAHDDIAGLVLDRSATVETVIARLEEGKTAFVIGPSGVGKSVILQAVFARLSNRGPVLYLSGRRLQLAALWTALCDDIGIERDRSALISALATNPDGITLVIDAVEHIESVGAKSVLADLLLACAEACSAGVANGTKVVFATRDHMFTEVTSWLGLQRLPPISRVDVGTVTEEEAQQIHEHTPRLRQLLSRVKSNHVTRNLFILRLLSDERIPETALPNDSASEVDMLDAWWEHVLIRSDGDYFGRIDTVYLAAAAAANSPSGLVILSGVDSAAITSLERDRILVRDPRTDRYRFGHDILQEWVLFRWLNRDPNRIEDRLHQFRSAVGFYRPVSLLAQALLERADPLYDKLLEHVADKDGMQRWHQAFVTAMITSARARSILDRCAARLMANDATLLRDLLATTKAEQVDIEDEVLNFAITRGMDAAEATAVALLDPKPRFLVWAPLINFCIAKRERLAGAALLPFVELIEVWQRRTAGPFPFRRAILDIGCALLEQLESWRRHDAEAKAAFPVKYDDARRVEELSRSIVAASGDVDVKRVQSYLRDLTASGYSSDQQDILKHAIQLARTVPEDLADFALSVLVDRTKRQPWERDHTDMGLRPRTFYPPSDVRGPFLPLLRMNEDAGLRLVRELANHATAYYEADIARGGKYSRFGAHFRVLELVVGGSRTSFVGDERVYSWFRPGSYDSSVLTSGLMALETWAYQALKQGRDAGDVIGKLLNETTCVAHLGIAVGLAYDFPAVLDLLVEAIASPMVWRLESHRERQDHASYEDVQALLPAEWRLPELEPEIKKRNRERDAERSAHRTMITLAVQLLFTRDAVIRDRFLARCAKAALQDACTFVEEADHVAEAEYAHEIYADFAAKTNPANFSVDGGFVKWNPPPSMLPDPVALENQALRQAITTCDLVGSAALQDYRAPAGLDAFLAVGRRAEDALAAGQLHGDDAVYAGRAAVRAAAVVLAFDETIAVRTDDLAWCIGVIRRAAEELEGRDWDRTKEDHEVGDLRVSLATGLGAAYAVNPYDETIRRLLFGMVSSGLVFVAAGAMRGIIPLWRFRPATALNLLAMVVQIAVSEERTEHLASDEVAKILAYETAGAPIPLPRIAPSRTLATYRVCAALGALPRRFTNYDAVESLLPLVTDIFSYVRAQPSEQQRQQLELTSSVATTAVNLLAAIDGEREERFLVSLSDWRSSAELYAEVVSAFARSRLCDDELTDRDLNQFEVLCDTFFRSDHSKELVRAHLPESLKAIVWHMVFIQDVVPNMMPDDWPNAARLSGHVTKWVAAVGGHPDSFAALTVFLTQFADAFSAVDVVDWVFCAWKGTASALIRNLWDRSGARTAELLMKVYLREPSAFSNGASSLTRLMDLTHELVLRGFPVAGEVQRAIEGSNKR